MCVDVPLRGYSQFCMSACVRERLRVRMCVCVRVCMCVSQVRAPSSHVSGTTQIREIHICVHVYMYMYIYIYTFVCTEKSAVNDLSEHVVQPILRTRFHSLK